MAGDVLSLVKEVRASGPHGAGAFLTLAGERDLSIFEGAHPADEATLWSLGSIGKTFTATALACLVVQGRLSLDTTVGRVLGADAGCAADRTLEQLATHTSGLPRVPGSALGILRKGLSAQPYASLDEAGITRALRRTKPKPPGTFAYSNFGYLVLGVVLARAAGAPFPDVLRHEVLEPLGLTGVRVGPLEPGDPHLPGHASGHERERWVHPVPACGGIAATLPDLRTWAEANLSPDTTPIAAAMRLAHEPHGESGLGWMFGKAPHTLWHNGAESGCYALTVIDTKLQLAFGFVSNSWKGKEPEGMVNAWLRHRVAALVTPADEPGAEG